MKERDVHRDIVELLRIALPLNAFVGTIPGGDGSRTMAPGYVRGTPDILCVVLGFPTILIEVKGPRGQVSDAQRRVHGQLSDAGAHVMVARGFDDALAGLRAIGVPLRARFAA